MGESQRVNIGVRLLPHTIEAIDAAADRIGKSRAFVIEVLVALYSKSIDEKTEIPITMIPVDGRGGKRTKMK
jgi:hypothetical protein